MTVFRQKTTCGLKMKVEDLKDLAPDNNFCMGAVADFSEDVTGLCLTKKEGGRYAILQAYTARRG